MEKKFSIIIPMYNAEKYIKRCIESVINQTHTNLEIIVINDGSTDNSLTICQNIAKTDSRVIIIDKTNGGVSSARNQGIEKASGEYIFFLDSDDWIESNSIEILNKIVEQNNADYIIYNSKENTLNNRYINQRENLNKVLPNLIISEKINAPWGKLFKNSLLKQNNIKFLKGISIAEDFLFNIEYYTKISSLYICQEKIYNFDISNQESLSRKYNPKKYEQLILVNDKATSLFLGYNDDRIMNALKYIRLKNIISCCLDLFDKRCDYSTKEKKNIIKAYKKNNKRIIIKKLGIKLYLLGIAYTILPSTIIYYILKCVYNNKRSQK